MAAGGVVGDTASDLIKSLTTAIRDKLQGNEAVQEHRALSEAEAIERARWLVAERYFEDPPDLTVRSSEVGPSDGAEVVLRSGRTGRTFTCTYVVDDGFVSLCRLRTENP